MPRLWRVSKQRNYVTAADFVRGRFDSSLLALAVALTGILATMPYIALQLTGIQAVLTAMGLSGHGLMKDLPLIIAFVILAAYTYTSGLRAPALTAILKDLLIYVTVIVACIAIPMQLGGYGHIFHVAAAALPAKKGSLILSPKLFSAFATLALGSAFALLLYPHAVTGSLGAKSGRTIQRNAALLPLYSLALTFIALLGYMAIAAGIHTTDTNLVVPLLFLKTLPTWFAGFAFGAIAIGALVPAAIMAIAAANLFTRNIYREYFAAKTGRNREAQVAKIVGMIVIIGALFFIVVIPLQYAIYFQTLGGIWILQTVPAIMFGLYTRWFHRWALLLGWLVGMVVGTGMAALEIAPLGLEILADQIIARRGGIEPVLEVGEHPRLVGDPDIRVLVQHVTQESGSGARRAHDHQRLRHCCSITTVCQSWADVLAVSRPDFVIFGKVAARCRGALIPPRYPRG
jgi:SSS family solute:Na+ symporter